MSTRPNSQAILKITRDARRNEPRFEGIGQHRAHEYVADLIRRQIGLGLLARGASLPPERDLARQLSVGRSTVQLAIGLLEAERLVETKRGRGGGTFVVAPAPGSRALDQRLLEARHSWEAIAEAIEYRLIVEPASAGAAANHGSRREVAAIERAHEGEANAADDDEFTRFDSAFHLAIAQASHNRFICDAIEQTRLRLNSALLLLPESKTFQEASVVEHSRVLRAILDRDAEAASKHMLSHVERSARNVRTLLRSLRGNSSSRT
jgi:GntR family transcriptional regulator, transcriptional repressor for pyruvate dehydrogenase complex